MRILQIKTILFHGQTMVTLLFFVVIALTITSAAVAMVITNSQSTTKFEQGLLAYYVAEGGVENALLRLLRNPNYTGETLSVGEGTAVITVAGTDPKTITSLGTVRNFSRKIQLVAEYTNNILSVTSWKEVYN